MHKTLFSPLGAYDLAKETSTQSTHNAITALCEQMPQ